MRAVVADDELLLREGVARLLEDAGIDVVARAGDADDLGLYVSGLYSRGGRCQAKPAFKGGNTGSVQMS